MQNNYFKKITNLFKSKLDLERDLANQHFYNSFRDEVISSDIIDLIHAYHKSGFKIDISHKKYIGKDIVNQKFTRQTDSFEYVWSALLSNTHKIISPTNNISQQDIKDTLLILLKDMVTDNYKKHIKSGKSGFLRDFYNFHNSPHAHWPNYNVTELIKEGFMNVDILREYLHTFELSTSLHNVTVLTKTLCKTKAEYLSKEEIINFRELKNELVQNKVVLEQSVHKKVKEIKKDNRIEQSYFDINKLSSLYNKPSLATEVEKKDNLQALSSLKKALLKMNKKENAIKELSTDIFNHLETIVNFNKLPHYKDHQHYVTNLLTKHLPDIFDNYFELPDTYRTTVSEKNNPQQVFEEILKEINKKLIHISEDLFQNNLTNLNIKKRFMNSI